MTTNFSNRRRGLRDHIARNHRAHICDSDPHHRNGSRPHGRVGLHCANVHYDIFDSRDRTARTLPAAHVASAEPVGCRIHDARWLRAAANALAQRGDRNRSGDPPLPGESPQKAPATKATNQEILATRKIQVHTLSQTCILLRRLAGQSRLKGETRSRTKSRGTHHEQSAVGPGSHLGYEPGSWV